MGETESKEQEKKKAVTKYVGILILILTLLTATMSYIMNSYYSEMYSLSFVSIPIYFLVIGVIILTLVSDAVYSQDVKKFQRNFMLTRTIKILSFLVFAIVGTLCTEGKLAFIICTFVYAMVYMAFEIMVLLKLNKKTHEFQNNSK